MHDKKYDEARRLSEQAEWDARVAERKAQAAKADKTYNLADLARQTPNEVLAAEGPEATATFRAQRAQPPQVKRGPAQLLDYTSATLDKSLAAYRAGDREQAYDLSVAAYLEGFELVESSLDNVDSSVRKTTEKALMRIGNRCRTACQSNRSSSVWTRPKPCSKSLPGCWAAMV